MVSGWGSSKKSFLADGYCGFWKIFTYTEDKGGGRLEVNAAGEKCSGVSLNNFGNEFGCGCRRMIFSFVIGCICGWRGCFVSL